MTDGPAGRYRCTGIRTEMDSDYREPAYGDGMQLNSDGTGYICFDDYFYNLSWSLDDNYIEAKTDDEFEIPMGGGYSEGIIELVYDGNIRLRFQKMTQEDIDQEAVDFLRFMMEDTEMQLAAAYLGWLEGDVDMDTWLRENCSAQLYANPFITSIPDECIAVAQTYGEVYCVVPADPDATVVINLMQEGTNEVREVLYRGESGEPVLLLCNGGGFYPDTQVIVTGSNGEEFIWYPQTGEYGLLGVPTNDDLEPLVYDFSDYAELYPDSYNTWLGQGWWMVTKSFLTSTCWTYYDDVSAEYPEERWWSLNLMEDGTAELMMSSTTDYTENYEGTWSLSDGDDGLTYLSLELVCTEGNGAAINGNYVALSSPYEDGLLIGMHADQQTLPVPDNGDTVSIWWAAVG